MSDLQDALNTCNQLGPEIHTEEPAHAVAILDAARRVANLDYEAARKRVVEGGTVYDVVHAALGAEDADADGVMKRPGAPF